MIKWVGPLTSSKSGGVYRVICIQIIGDIEFSARVYLNPEHKNYHKWSPLLEEGTLVKGLVWKDKSKKLLDGDSPVEQM